MKSIVTFLLLFPLIAVSQSQVGNTILGLANIKSFGNSVAISSDGTYVAIGAPGTGNESYARVYKIENGTWTQIGSDITNVAILERVGSSIAISDDGNIVAVGARQAGNLDHGHTRIYKNENGVWTQIGNDIIGESSFDEAGSSIAMSADGNIIAIGAPLNDAQGSKAGQVRVYKNENNVWTQMGVDIDGDAAGNQFGTSVSLSADGTIVAIGAHLFSANKGQVKVFTYDNNTWTQLGNDIVGAVGGDYVGLEVSLANDGHTLATFDARGNNANPQHIRVFKFENGAWALKGNPISIGKSSSINGSISLSGNGTILAYGSASTRKVTAYEFENNDWSKKGKDISSSSGFGHAIALSDNGKKVVIGWPLADHSGQNNNGAAEVYDLSGVLDVAQFQKNTTHIYPNPANDILHIRTTATIEKVTIYNILGKQVLTTSQKRIAIQHLKPGIYVLQMHTKHGKEVAKFVKE